MLSSNPNFTGHDRINEKKYKETSHEAFLMHGLSDVFSARNLEREKKNSSFTQKTLRKRLLCWLVLEYFSLFFLQFIFYEKLTTLILSL